MPGLMGLDEQAKFNGVIEYNGQKIPVQNGQFTLDQHQFFVSRNGRKLLDQGNRQIATIDNGKVIPLQ